MYVPCYVEKSGIELLIELQFPQQISFSCVSRATELLGSFRSTLMNVLVGDVCCVNCSILNQAAAFDSDVRKRCQTSENSEMEISIYFFDSYTGFDECVVAAGGLITTCVSLQILNLLHKNDSLN